jgi:flagellar biosynthesis/type III secretory pathway chaperone
VDEKLRELSALLRDEVSLYEALKADLDYELQQDGKLDGSEMLRLQQRKQAQLRRIQELEQDRIGVVKALAKVWNEAPGTLTLRRIIPKAPEAVGTELQERHTALLGLVASIRELSRAASGNAGARLKAVDATLNMIHETVRVHSTYSESGKLHAPPVTLKYTSA